MVFFRRSLLLVLGILLMVFVVACIGFPNTGMNSSSAPATMTTQTNSSSAPATMTTQTNKTQNGNQANGNQNNQGSGQVPAPTITLISTIQVIVNGHKVTVLTNKSGMTLYERTSDPAPGSNCTGPCAHIWPPFLSKGTVMGTASIGGKLTVHLTVNGKQVEYNGHPLYTYSGDMAPGQTNGQGVGNVWQIATVTLQRQHW